MSYQSAAGDRTAASYREKSHCDRVLFICNTYYQLLVAIQLRLTLYEGHSADLWLSDLSVHSSEVASNLNSMKLFDRVEHTASKEWLSKQSRMNYIDKVHSLCFVGHDIKSRRTPAPYDLIIFFNITDEIYWISNASRALGGRGELARMEEGLASCDSNHAHYVLGRNVIREEVRSILGRPCISDPQLPFYCFIPELCDADFPAKPLPIPSISQTKDELATAMRGVFRHVEFPYSQQFIYFASSTDVDGYSFGETEMVLKIASIVGKHNLAVKMHPRDGRDVYRKAGLTVVENSYVPWEVFQLCNDFSERTFLSATSGSFLTMSAIGGNRQPSSLFVAPDHMTETQKDNWLFSRDWIDSTVDKLHKLGLCNNIYSIFVSEIPDYISTQGSEICQS